jgi:hypothetical protein
VFTALRSGGAGGCTESKSGEKRESTYMNVEQGHLLMMISDNCHGLDDNKHVRLVKRKSQLIVLGSKHERRRRSPARKKPG